MDKMPPHSVDAEQAVLGAALISCHAVAQVLEMLEKDDFYLESHRKVFDVIAYLAGKESPVDTLSVTEELRKREQLERVGGIAYILTLNESVPTAAHVEYYARTVSEKSTLRKLINAASDITALAHEQGREIADVVDEAGRLVSVVQSRKDVQRAANMGELIDSTATWFCPGIPRPEGINTGFPAFDKMTGGLMPTWLSILAARPSMGKSALSLTQLALNLARQKCPVLIYSLEMDRYMCLTRFYANLSGVDGLKILRRDYQDDEWSRVLRAMDVMRDLPIYIQDKANLASGELRSHARREVKDHGARVVLIDHLQHIPLPEKETSEHLGIKRVVHGIKTLTQELDVHTILLSQLNRNVEKREDKRPLASDLRESGSIEEYADLIAVLYRDGYYQRNSEGAEPDEGETELIIRKGRNGQVGTVRLQHRLSLSRYWQSDERHAGQEPAERHGWI